MAAPPPGAGVQDGRSPPPLGLPSRRGGFGSPAPSQSTAKLTGQ